MMAATTMAMITQAAIRLLDAEELLVEPSGLLVAVIVQKVPVNPGGHMHAERVLLQVPPLEHRFDVHQSTKVKNRTIFKKNQRTKFAAHTGETRTAGALEGVHEVATRASIEAWVRGAFVDVD
jgi:hypothetical protein